MTIGPITVRPDLTALRAVVGGAVHGPGDAGYATTGFNLAVTRTPCAVVDVADTDDIAAVIRFAGDAGLRVAVFATGHGGVEVGPDTVLVRTAALDVCEIDPSTRTARIGAGVRVQTVLDAAAPHGLALVCGSSTTVGVVGFLTGGGIGPLVRSLGSSAGYVRSVRVVTGDGTVTDASAEVNPELFWGLRGGKATLGIITEVVVDLLPISEIYGGAVYFDGAEASGLLRAWRDWAADLPREAGTSVALMRLPEMPGVPPALAGRLTVAVRFAAVGDHGAAQRLLAPMRAAATPLLDAIGPLPYAAIGAMHADPAVPMPVHEGTTLLRDVSDGTIDAIVGAAGPRSASQLIVVELRQLGGAFADEQKVRSAFGHRDAAFNLHAVGVLAPPPGPDHGSADGVEPVSSTTAHLLAAVRPWSTGTSLANFNASADPAVIRTCYDEDTYAWLAALAARLDPRGVLHTGQVVR